MVQRGVIKRGRPPSPLLIGSCVGGRCETGSRGLVGPLESSVSTSGFGETACGLQLLEKVVGKGYRYAAKQLGVDRAFSQDFVNIGAVAADFLGEPCSRTSLAAEFIADE